MKNLLFTAKSNTPREWIELGRTLERFLLKTTSLGIANAYMNPPCCFALGMPIPCPMLQDAIWKASFKAIQTAVPGRVLAEASLRNDRVKVRIPARRRAGSPALRRDEPPLDSRHFGIETSTGRLLMEDGFRRYLAESVAGYGAHIPFDQAVDGFPPERAGERVENLAHTAWMLVYHMRMVLEDIIDYVQDPSQYEAHEYPSGYWPERDAPPSEEAWYEEVERVKRAIATLHEWALDTSRDLYATIPGTPEHNLARQLTLMVAHNGYHIGQLVDLRMLLGIPVRDW